MSQDEYRQSLKNVRVWYIGYCILSFIMGALFIALLLEPSGVICGQ